MESWLNNARSNSKVLFYLLIPLVLIFVFRDLLLSVLIGSARKMADEAKKKDAELKAEEDKLNSEADRLKSEADRIEDEIKKGNDDEDWHRKKK